MSDADQSRTNGEKRGARRGRVLKSAVIAYPDPSLLFPCPIRHRPDQGARLKLPDGQFVPGRFWVIDVAEAKAYDTGPVWYQYPEIGVGLTDPVDVRQAGEDRIQR